MHYIVASEGGWQNFELHGGEWTVLVLSALSAVLALGVGWFLMLGVLKADAGTIKMQEIAGSEWEVPADLVLLAMGFVSPISPVLDAFGVSKDARGNAKAGTEGKGAYATNVAKVFAAGDMRRGQSLVVWSIREGRQAARAVDEYLMGMSDLPR